MCLYASTILTDKKVFIELAIEMNCMLENHCAVQHVILSFRTTLMEECSRHLSRYWRRSYNNRRRLPGKRKPRNDQYVLHSCLERQINLTLFNSAASQIRLPGIMSNHFAYSSFGCMDSTMRRVSLD